MTHTRTKKIFALSGVAILATLMVMAFVPSASAQLGPVCGIHGQANFSGENLPPAQNLRPLETAPMKLSFDYGWENGATSLTPIQVTISLKPGSGVTVIPTEVTRTVSIGTDGQAGSQPINVDFSVMVHADTPYRNQVEIGFEATATEGTCVTAPDPASDSFSVQAGFYENWEARFERMFIPTGQNAHEVIPLTVTNSGNGPIMTTIDFHERSSDSLEVILPSTFRVDRATGGESVETTRNIEVNTPFKNGYENRIDQLMLTLKAEPDPRDDRIEMRSHTVNAVIRTQGVYVPGFEAAFMVFAMLGAALVVMRRR